MTYYSIMEQIHVCVYVYTVQEQTRLILKCENWRRVYHFSAQLICSKTMIIDCYHDFLISLRPQTAALPPVLFSLLNLHLGIYLYNIAKNIYIVVFVLQMANGQVTNQRMKYTCDIH